MRSPGWVLRSAIFVAAAAAAPVPAQAQYFGRNKVQYQSFDFKILRTDHFDIYYYPQEREAAEIASRLAERWYARLSRHFDHEMRSRQPIILYASHPDFEQTNAIPGQLGEGTGGVTEFLKRRIVLPFAGPLAETDHVLGHELVHAFQFDITTNARSRTGAVPGAAGLPLWFVEGMAEYLSLGPEDAHTAMWMRDASTRKLPYVRNLDHDRYFPYRYGHAFWAYVAGRWGDEVVGSLLKQAGRSGNLEQALLRLLKLPEKELSEGWHAAMHDVYDSLRARTKAPKDVGRLLLGAEGDDGGLNIAPALSPDGKQLAFISARDLFSVEMFLADAETGRVLRKIVKTAVDPHFESLQFINSSGAWAPDGRRFAFGGVARGKAVLSVIDAESGAMLDEVAFGELGEIFSPTWSPDSRQIAFSAIAGGLTDLHIYDLESRRLRRLTTDPYADLQPAWSPDGREIAFVTDRFTTDLETLAIGPYRLALLDVATGGIRAAATSDTGKSINPQWTPDGSGLYFLSDRNGIANLYRVDLRSGDLAQITDLFTGVSGITPLSPALSVAAGTGKVAFSVFENDGFRIYAIDDSASLAGGPPGVLAEASPALLPPQDRARGVVAAALADAVTGLPPDSAFATRRYSAGLSLDYVAQPYLAVGADRFGTAIGGGAALYWSDMLGEHNLSTALQAYGSFKDIAAGVGYTNLKRRLNWGAALQMTPYQSLGFRSGLARAGNRIVAIDSVFRFRQTATTAGGLASYPFSRVQRVDLSASLVNIRYSAELEVDVYDPVTFDRLDHTSTSIDLGIPSLNLGQVSTALVYDNSFFGATSPILGQRWRLEAAPTIGSLTWLNVLGDYRRYLLPVRPFTIAFRALHYGRYGGDADTSALTPLFIGYQTLVRGYDLNSFSASECGPPTTVGCPVFERLVGSKIAVANLELRFPLLGALGIGRGFYGYFPIELGLFADAGLAWRNSDQAWFLGGSRRPVYSVGAAMRVNVFGFAVVELDLSHPFNRGKNWIWQLNFAPGF